MSHHVTVRKHRLPALALAILLATIATIAHGAGRPTIGIALGGGGARGMAHIGVLQRLDELRIPIHCVSGTSAGAVVGAFTALGFTPTEIEHLTVGADWRQFMSDRPDRRDLSFRRKTDTTDNIWPFEFGLTDQGLGLQRGFLFGQNFHYVFDTPGLYTAGYDGFDNLPIPFHPVANDLVTGESIVLKSGNLLRAVQASMAAPGGFPPVELDGRILVDGYLRTMIPVDAVRDMGADKVIAIHVGWNPGELPPGGVWNVPSILMQSSFILTWANTAPDLARADVAITVPLPDIPLIDLSQVEKAIAAGRLAVDAHLDALAPLALSEADYAAWRATTGRRKAPAPVITTVSVDDLDHVNKRTVLGRIHQTPGDTLDFPGLVRDLNEIFKLGTFESVGFSLPPVAHGRELVIQPVEKPYLPWILRVGGSYRMNYQNRGQLQLRTRIARLEINRFGGEFRGDLALGSLHSARAEFHQPLVPSRTLFIAPGLFLDSHDESVFDGTFRRGEYRTESRGYHVDVGLTIGRYAEVRAGLWRGRTQSDTQAGTPGVSARDDDMGAVRLGLNVDWLDDTAVPHSGLAGGLVAWLARPSLGDDLEYERYRGHLVGAVSSGPWTLQMRTEAGDSEGEMPYYHEFITGGFRRITGVPDESLRGGAFAMGGAGVLYHLAGLELPYAPQWYLGGWLDVGNTWDSLDQANLRDALVGSALSVLVETPIGPMEAGYGHSSCGRNTVFLQAGIHFAQPFDP